MTEETWRTIPGIPEECGKKYLVHHLVLWAFVGRAQVGQECRHVNGLPGDNRLCNLVWDTRAANMADRLKHGYVYPKKERNPNYRHGKCCNGPEVFKPYRAAYEKSRRAVRKAKLCLAS